MSTSTEQAPNHPLESPRRGKPSRAVLAYVAAITIVIIGGSMFWLTGSKSSSVVTHHQPTPTATSAPLTLTPNELTPSLLAIFYDTFPGNFRGWSLGSNGGYFRIMVNNSLILADTNPKSTLIESFPTITNLDNYVVSIDFTINQGDANDGTGLYLRGDGTLDHDYRIDVNGNNTLDIAKEYLDSQQASQTNILAPSVHSEYLKPPGYHNTLTVIMIGPEITVEINNIVALTTRDPAYTNGQIALFARHGATSSGVTVSFTRVEIDRLASQFMTPVPTPTLTPTTSTAAGQP